MIQTTNLPKVIVRREIKAPADELFDAWLDPASLAVWMRPGDISHSVAHVDPKIGGAFEIVMHNAAGPIVHSGEYRIIERPRRLVFTWISAGTKQTQSLVTVDFNAGRRTTEVVLTHEQLPDDNAVKSHTKGWTQILEMLARQFGAAETH
ncbi:MAG: hypothetical protein HW417_1075 [Steroidobacteraceae bacterium]|nr:hypothetical protein [Steroidobacteraceae bacterium]MBM2854147.1 hypothetical protein [Steroidobacteraceae bacterium]